MDEASSDSPNIHTCMHTYRQTDRQTYRETGRKTDRQTDRQTDNGLGHNVKAVHHDGTVGGRAGDFDVVREESDKAASALSILSNEGRLVVDGVGEGGGLANREIEVEAVTVLVDSGEAAHQGELSVHTLHYLVVVVGSSKNISGGHLMTRSEERREVTISLVTS